MPETPEMQPGPQPPRGSSPHAAARRRDQRLARIRRLTLWVTGGAAGASLGLGVAFAHALPGHAVSAPATTPAPAPSASAPPASHHSGPPGRARHSNRLTAPKQQPTAPKQQQATHSPPVVSSGGS
jgi:hypothetical protein